MRDLTKIRKHYTRLQPEHVIIERRRISVLNEKFRVYKTSAKRRGYEFSLTKDQIEVLLFSTCHFCGIGPSNVRTLVSRIGLTYVTKYQGIDRLDNNRGYHVDNCVPCCSDCNRAKSDMTLEDFYRWINRLKDTSEIIKT